jgi:prevent-host-death family protein
MPIIEARNALTRLPEVFEATSEMGAVAVTRRGKPVLAILPWELYETLTETLEVMGDPALMEAFRRGVAEAQAGEGAAWEDVRESLVP